VFAAQGTLRGPMSAQQEQVVPLVEGESQPTRDGSKHLLGRLGASAAFQPREVVGGHITQLGDLLTAQPVRAPPRATPQTDVRGLQCLAPSAQEGTKRLPVRHPRHNPMVGRFVRLSH